MRNAPEKGFTLVEMLVAVSLFAVAATIGLGALLIINNAYRMTRAQQVAIDNLNFALESMTRSIRTGSTYDCLGNLTPVVNSCTGSPNPPNDEFSLIDISGRTVHYELVEVDDRGSIHACAFTDLEPCVPVALTSPDVDIDTLTFYVIDAPGSSGQPRVVIIIKGVAGARERELTPFSLQTTITARN